MKYRHRYHAGNFADVHKHVTLLALLAALQKKDKGFLYLDTHAGRGAYDLAQPSTEASRAAQAGLARLAAAPEAAELRAYLQRAATLRAALSIMRTPILARRCSQPRSCGPRIAPS